MMNTWAAPAGPYNWSQEVHFDAAADTIYFYGGMSATPLQVTGLTYDTWVELRHEIDLDLDTCDVFYDGQPVYSYSWSLGTWSTGVAQFTAIDLWAATASTTEVYWDDFTVFQPGASVGTTYCNTAIANSTGQSADIEALGSDLVSMNSLQLSCTQMPTNQFAYFLNSLSQGFVPGPGGSQGNLCLGGGIGRYNSAIQNSGANGAVNLTLDLGNTPTPMGAVNIAVGETWNFQCWYRDLNPGATSNFSNAVAVTFQ